MSTNQKSNNRGVTAITKNADNTITWSGSDVQILTLAAGTVSGTYAFYTGSGYLYAASSSANHLRTGTLNDNASWAISVSAAGAATIQAKGTFTRNLMRYNTSMLIACYGAGNTQKDLCFYKAVASGTTMYTIGGCTHEQTTTVPGWAASCTEPGMTTGILCAICNQVLQEQVEIPVIDHGYVDGVCLFCGAKDPSVPEKFDIDVARMILGNALEFQFGVAQTKIPDTTGYYAEIEKTWADGTTTTKTIPATEWGTAGQYWAIVYDGLAAKEMSDVFYVTIYNAEGKAVSNSRTDSVRAYVERAYASQKATGKTMMVDMLNYGAAAQTHFSYGTDDLCNNKLTDEQKAVATTATPEMSNDQVKGTNYNGSRFILQSRIQVQLGFKGLTEGMYAIYTYTDNNGNVKETRVKYADFVASGSTKIGVELSALVYADARALVEVTIYNADGTVHGTAADSIESCSYRSSGDVFVYLMKFADSAKAHLYG